MSVHATNWVWRHSVTVGNDRLVLLAIADRANDEGADAWPSIATIETKTRLSKSTVLRCIGRLESIGEMVVERRGHGQSNNYRLTFQEGDYGRCHIDTTSDRDGGVPSQPGQPVAVDTQCQSDTGINLTPVSPVTPVVVSLLTPNTSCTSRSLSPRAREATPRGQSVISPGEAIRWDSDQRKQHRGCHPECCRWQDTTRGLCIPAALVDELGSRLIGVDRVAAIADVLAWARADAPPAGTVAQGSVYAHWAARWDATRTTAAARVARPIPAARAVADADATDALIRDLSRARA